MSLLEEHRTQGNNFRLLQWKDITAIVPAEKIVLLGY
jgi:hypothetical protein